MSPIQSGRSFFYSHNCVVSIDKDAERVSVAALNMPKLFDAINDQSLRERISEAAAEQNLAEFLLVYVVGGREFSYENVSLPAKSGQQDVSRCIPDHLLPYLQRSGFD